MKFCPACGSNIPDDANVCPVCGASLEQEEYHRALPSGFILQNGKYKIEKVLGEGGFGITYLGYNTMLDFPVAIKEYFPSEAVRLGNFTLKITYKNSNTKGESGKAAFLDEGKRLAQFRNPHIARAIDAFEENNTTYLVVEFIEGTPLSELIAIKGKLTPEEVVDYIVQICDPLKEIHDKNMIHQDIKPDNIMITPKNLAVLIDFGSARQFQADKTGRYTQLLTPGYAPLEQYGSNVKRGPFTDIYALGAVMYHALKGEKPPASIDLVYGQELDLSGIDEKLASIIKKAMSVRIEDRPQTIDEFLSLLKDTGYIKDCKSFEISASSQKPASIVDSFEALAKKMNTEKILSESSSYKEVTELKTSYKREFDFVLSFAYTHFSIINCGSFVNEDLIVFGGWDSTVSLFSLTNKEKIGVFKGNLGPVNKVFVSKDKKFIASGDANRAVLVFDISTFEKVFEGKKHLGAIVGTAITEDNKLISASIDNTVKVWDFLSKNPNPLYDIKTKQIGLESFAFSQKRYFVATGAQDKTIKIFNLFTNQEIRTITGHKDKVSALVFSEDGKYIISGSWDKTIKIFEVDTGKELLSINAHNERISSIDITSDGKYIISGSWDKTIKIFEVDTGKELYSQDAELGKITCVKLSYDNTKLLATGFDKVIKVWKV